MFNPKIMSDLLLNVHRKRLNASLALRQLATKLMMTYTYAALEMPDHLQRILIDQIDEKDVRELNQMMSAAPPEIQKAFEQVTQMLIEDRVPVAILNQQVITSLDMIVQDLANTINSANPQHVHRLERAKAQAQQFQREIDALKERGVL